jgi:hypothetical protein
MTFGFFGSEAAEVNSKVAVGILLQDEDVIFDNNFKSNRSKVNTEINPADNIPLSISSNSATLSRERETV